MNIREVDNGSAAPVIGQTFDLHFDAFYYGVAGLPHAVKGNDPRQQEKPDDDHSHIRSEPQQFPCPEDGPDEHECHEEVQEEPEPDAGKMIKQVGNDIEM